MKKKMDVEERIRQMERIISEQGQKSALASLRYENEFQELVRLNDLLSSLYQQKLDQLSKYNLIICSKIIKTINSRKDNKLNACCYNCGSPRHFARNCTKPPSK